MSKVLVWVFIFTLVSLACGMQSNLPAAVGTQTATQVSIDVNSTATPEMAQITGSWNFRTSPGEDAPLIDTLTDVEVQLIDCKDTSGGTWCFVEYQRIRGWVNKRGLK